MAVVLISGGTGLIGTALTRELARKGHHVIILTRNLKTAVEHYQHAHYQEVIQYAEWDVKRQTIDPKAVQRADYVVHLAGTNVAGGRWTPKRKQEIVESRTQSSALLVKALREIPNRVQAVVSASAIGWYGPDPQIPNPRPFSETAPNHGGFLGSTVQQWEDSIKPVMELGKRLVILRTGIVLSNEGGAYTEFKKTLRFGVASILGSGNQVVSWIHITDLARIYVEALENSRWQGVYNAVAPYPVSNKELMWALARHSGGFNVRIPVPALALKVVLGEMSIEVLKSATVSSRKIEDAGYQFFFPNIDTALANLNKKAS